MKALVYQGPGRKALKDRPMPEIAAPGDAIVKMLKTTICGTDLHILKGDVPTCAPGRILGHEGVGVVDGIGAGVTAFKAGDKVLISCISSCGKCEYCRAGCTRTARPAAGFSATRSTARRPNTSASRTPTRASIRSPRAPTRKRWSCSATSCRPGSSAACSTARSSPVEPSPSSAPGRSASPRC